MGHLPIYLTEKRKILKTKELVQFALANVSFTRYFDKDSLISYFKYRECAEDFSKDKAIEHRNYLKVLEYISLNDKSDCREEAARCLSAFQVIKNVKFLEFFMLTSA